MYFVNNKFATSGIVDFRIKDGDSIVYFFTEDYIKGNYTWFAKDRIKTETGKEVTIQLKGTSLGSSGSSNSENIDGATILVDDNDYKVNGEAVKTDENGKATLIFEEKGTYYISAERSDGGNRNISRPYCEIIVKKGKTSSSSSSSSEEQTEKEVKEAENATEEIKEEAENAKTEEQAKDVADKSVEVVETLAKLSGELDEESKVEIVEIVESSMENTFKVMDKITSVKESTKIASSMIDAVGQLVENVDNEKSKEIKQKAFEIAEKVIENASIQNVSGKQLTTESEKVTAKLDIKEIEDIVKQAFETVKQMKAKLDENNIESQKTLEVKLTIAIPNIGKKEIETKLPEGMMETLKENGIKEVKIETEVATFNISSKTFGEKAKGQEICLSAKMINKEDLSENQKQEIPEGSQIVDLNAKLGQEKISKFSEPIGISIPYEGKIEEGSQVKVFYLKDDGTIESVGGEYDEINKMVTFKTEHFSKYFAKQITMITKTFTDIQNYEWAREAIETMASRDIINGKSEGIFDPSGNITRAEFVAMMVRMLNYENSSENISFADVDKNEWYYNAIVKAYNHKLIDGKTETKFDPNGNITRQEIAKIISKVLIDKGYNQANLGVLDGFKDEENIATWAKSSIATCVNENIIDGIGGNLLAPIQNASRAEAAMMIYRIYNK